MTHSSCRLLAGELGMRNVSVAKVWRKWGQPWRGETFKFSTDPELEAKVRDIVGLYMDPPEKAVVLCVDEKSQIQALDRTAPILPMRPGLPEKATHDYVRHGTTTLFAALEVATGKVTDACFDRHRHQEFLWFLNRSRSLPADVELHLIVRQLRHPQDTPRYRHWLATQPADPRCTSPRRGHALVHAVAWPPLGIADATVARAWRQWGAALAARRRSSSPPTPNWRRRSATSSACT